VSYRVYRDGVPLTGAPVTATTVTDTGLAGGTTHGYEVTALDAAGNESARSAVASVTTPSDPAPTPPTAPGPVSASVAGSALGTATVPVQLGWAASSAGAVGYDVSVTSADGGTGLSTTATDPSASVSLAPGHSYEASVRARSADGLVSAWSRRSFTVTLAQENDATVTYSKGWGRKKVAGASGGSSEVTSTAASKATVRFTGTSVAWVATVGPAAGVASVSLDGASLGTVDLHAAALAPRQLVLARSGLQPGAHTLVVTFPTAGGKGKAATSIDLDAVATIR
jgi:hypothetical protein